MIESVRKLNSIHWLTLTAAVVLMVSNCVLTGAFAADEPQFGDDYVPTVFITGSNRGLGLGFTQQYLERGWNVIASCRKPEQADELQELAKQYPSTLTIEQLDVVDFDRVDALAGKYADTPIDILLLNAGISGGNASQMFTKMEFDVFADVLQVNTVAPLKMAEAFYEHVKSSREKKIITVSSSEGSIEQATQPRLYFYRSSKAAVNMVMKNLALQLKRRGISVAMVNPGPTDTDFMAGLPKSMLRPTEDAVSDMIRNIDGLTVDTTGAFYQYDGTIIPW